jgi:arsenate reductase (glutaredoxin)
MTAAPAEAAAARPEPGPTVQLFGRRDSADTRKALRFFRERRTPVSFVDVAVRAPAPTELRRFSSRLGAGALVDTEGRAYRDAGLAYLTLTDEELLEKLIANSRLLRLPLVRVGPEVVVGPDEAGWRRLLAGMP